MLSNFKASALLVVVSLSSLGRVCAVADHLSSPARKGKPVVARDADLDACLDKVGAAVDQSDQNYWNAERGLYS